VKPAIASWLGHASALACQWQAIAMNTCQGPRASVPNAGRRRMSRRPRPRLSRKRSRSRSGKRSSSSRSPGPAGRAFAASSDIVHAPSALRERGGRARVDARSLIASRAVSARVLSGRSSMEREARSVRATSSTSHRLRSPAQRFLRMNKRTPMLVLEAVVRLRRKQALEPALLEVGGSTKKQGRSALWGLG
jgi:hypothetical protein